MGLRIGLTGDLMSEAQMWMAALLLALAMVLSILSCQVILPH
jgi:hypothetical protein